MEYIIDKVVAELDIIANTDSEEGGIEDIITVGSDAKWDDPGVVLAEEYPFFMVVPDNENSKKETMGKAGSDTESHTLQIWFVLHQPSYFDESENQASGSRELVQVMGKTRRWFKRLAKRRLDNLAGVQDARVTTTSYTGQVREDSFLRIAVMGLVVDKNYQHED